MLRQRLILVNNPQRLINHLRAIPLDDLACQRRVADVVVRGINDDDVLDFWRLLRLNDDFAEGNRCRTERGQPEDHCSFHIHELQNCFSSVAMRLAAQYFASTAGIYFNSARSVSTSYAGKSTVSPAGAPGISSRSEMEIDFGVSACHFSVGFDAESPVL